MCYLSRRTHPRSHVRADSSILEICVATKNYTTQRCNIVLCTRYYWLSNRRNIFGTLEMKTPTQKNHITFYAGKLRKCVCGLYIISTCRQSSSTSVRVCVLHIEPFFLPVDIQHNQCPCRFFNPGRDASSVVINLRHRYNIYIYIYRSGKGGEEPAM